MPIVATHSGLVGDRGAMPRPRSRIPPRSLRLLVAHASGLRNKGGSSRNPGRSSPLYPKVVMSDFARITLSITRPARHDGFGGLERGSSAEHQDSSFCTKSIVDMHYDHLLPEDCGNRSFFRCGFGLTAIILDILLFPIAYVSTTIPLPTKPLNPETISRPPPAAPSGPSAPSSGPLPGPAGPSGHRPYAYDGKLPPKYKPAARRVTAIIVGLPVVFVVGYELYGRCKLVAHPIADAF